MKLKETKLTENNTLKYIFDTNILDENGSFKFEPRSTVYEDIKLLRKQLGLDSDLDMGDIADLGLYHNPSWGTPNGNGFVPPFTGYKIQDNFIEYSINKDYLDDIKSMFNVFEPDDEIGGYCNPESDWEEQWIENML